MDLSLSLPVLPLSLKVESMPSVLVEVVDPLYFELVLRRVRWGSGASCELIVGSKVGTGGRSSLCARVMLASSCETRDAAGDPASDALAGFMSLASRDAGGCAESTAVDSWFRDKTCSLPVPFLGVDTGEWLTSRTVDFPSSPVLVDRRHCWFLKVSVCSCKGDLLTLQLCSRGDWIGVCEAKNGDGGPPLSLLCPMGAGSRNIWRLSKYYTIKKKARKCAGRNRASPKRL